MPGRTLAADADAIVRADKTSAERAWLSLPPAPGDRPLPQSRGSAA
jgi:hypothetical protein